MGEGLLTEPDSPRSGDLQRSRFTDHCLLFTDHCSHPPDSPRSGDLRRSRFTDHWLL